MIKHKLKHEEDDRADTSNENKHDKVSEAKASQKSEHKCLSDLGIF